MMRTDSELRRLRASVAFVGRMSDSLVRLGPFSIGLDGVLSWIPGVGDLYSVGAGAFIILQGLRAGVSLRTLAAAAALVGLRTLIGSVPLAGAAAADLFLAHRWAAAMVVAEIDRMLGEGVRSAPGWPARAAA